MFITTFFFKQLLDAIELAILALALIMICLSTESYSDLLGHLGRCTYQGRFTDACMYADKALAARPSAEDRRDEFSEFCLASDLLSLGRYDQVELMTQYMPFTVSERMLAVQAYIGMTDYITAIVVLDQLISSGKVDGREANFELGRAHLGLGHTDEARSAFERMRCSCQSNDIINLYERLCKLSPDDDTGALRTTDSLISFWTEFKSERIPNLEFAARFMRQQGFEKCALKIERKVQEFKTL